MRPKDHGSEFVIVGIRFTKEQVAALDKRADELTTQRGSRVSRGGLAREIIHSALQGKASAPAPARGRSAA